MISLKPTSVVSKALVLAMPPLKDNAANESEDEEYGKEAYGGNKPGFGDQPRHTGGWSFRRKGK